jgi:hypothetical protein
VFQQAGEANGSGVEAGAAGEGRVRLPYLAQLPALLLVRRSGSTRERGSRHVTRPSSAA